MVIVLPVVYCSSGVLSITEVTMSSHPGLIRRLKTHQMLITAFGFKSLPDVMYTTQEAKSPNLAQHLDLAMKLVVPYIETHRRACYTLAIRASENVFLYPPQCIRQRTRYRVTL